eukprot:4111043-Karenia_brevis.AAC.1
MGRWGSDSAFNIYVQEAMALMVWNNIALGSMQYLGYLCESVEFVWTSAPSVPWRLLMSRKRIRNHRFRRWGLQAGLPTSSLRLLVSANAMGSL